MNSTIDAKMGVVLKELTRALCEFLGIALPRLNPDGWWHVLVLQNLSQQQAEHVRRRGGADLTSLDLVASALAFWRSEWARAFAPAVSVATASYPLGPSSARELAIFQGPIVARTRARGSLHKNRCLALDPGGAGTSLFLTPLPDGDAEA